MVDRAAATGTGGGGGGGRQGAGILPPTSAAENAVVVAVKAEKEISKTALEWALTHIVRPGDFVTLLAVIPAQTNKGRRWRFWSFPKFSADCSTNQPRRQYCETSASCSQMALQFHGGLTTTAGLPQKEVNMRIKVVMPPEGANSSSPSTSGGAVAAESKRVGANWVVFDKQLKQEAKQCMEELSSCNIVLVKRTHAEVLRLNLGPGTAYDRNNNSNRLANAAANGPTVIIPPDQPDSDLQPPAPLSSTSGPLSPPDSEENLKHSTPISSPDEEGVDVVDPEHTGGSKKTADVSECRASTSSSSDSLGSSSSPFSFRETNPLFQTYYNNRGGEADVLSGSPNPWNEPTSWNEYAMLKQQKQQKQQRFYQENGTATNRNGLALPPPSSKSGASTLRTLKHKFAESDAQDPAGVGSGWPVDMSQLSLIPDTTPYVRASPSMPPPLCSLCQHKTPVFGKPPRWFSYAELEDATDGFARRNFLAEGGFGWVYKGVLRDGQLVAVKRIKVGGSAKADREFKAEVEVLSRAQHRNVVMLIGFCLEGNTRILVYEYICNGSLASNLYRYNGAGGGKRCSGNSHRQPLEWPARVKVSVGAARGLRYLHEDCRVGFVHRDVRPNNILLTHDFEPLIADFGLARWQSDGAGDMGVDSTPHAVGTFGYMAPEYIETGAITEKADVYAFGMVLLELLTGRRAMDLSRPRGQQLLVEWARPFVASLVSEDGWDSSTLDAFLDPILDRGDVTRLFVRQVQAMARAAALCLRRDPQARPTMSKVLRLLEGDEPTPMDITGLSSRDDAAAGRQIPRKNVGPKGSYSHRFSHKAVSRAVYTDQKNHPADALL